MSADPYIQAPSDLQSFNRYAYVRNNPLNKTDPTGYSWWTKLRDKFIKPMIAAYLDIYCGGCATILLNAYNASQVKDANGHRLGWKGAFFSVGISLLGGASDNSIYQSGMNALSGCGMSAMAGGSCKKGAVEAVTNDNAGPVIGGCINASRAGQSCAVGAREGATSALGGWAARETAGAAHNYLNSRGSASASASSGSSASNGGSTANGSNSISGSNLEDRITVAGGTAEQQLEVTQSVKRIGATDVGRELNSAIPTGNITINIVPGPNFTAEATLGPPYVTTVSTQFVDRLVCCYVGTKGDLSPFTLDRILSHELGHHTGLADFGTPNAMGNVNKWENRIMRQVSPPQPDRGNYYLPPSFTDYKLFKRRDER